MNLSRTGNLSRTQLETAALEVLQMLKTLPDLSTSRVAVIGGLALWSYIPRGRGTMDIDLIINIDSAPNSIKSRLISLNNSLSTEQAWILWYNSPTGTRIRVDIFASWQFPYLPLSSTVISTIEDGAVPYISAVDLVVFKIHSCGQRPDKLKRYFDAQDAVALLKQETTSSPFTLTAVQKSTVEARLPDAIEYSNESEEWWKKHLGL